MRRQIGLARSATRLVHASPVCPLCWPTKLWLINQPTSPTDAVVVEATRRERESRQVRSSFLSGPSLQKWVNRRRVARRGRGVFASWGSEQRDAPAKEAHGWAVPAK